MENETTNSPRTGQDAHTLRQQTPDTPFSLHPTAGGLVQLCGTCGDTSPFIAYVQPEYAEFVLRAMSAHARIANIESALEVVLERLYDHTRFGVLSHSDMLAMEQARAALAAARNT